MNRTLLIAALGSALGCPGASAQTDILMPSGSLDGIYRLVDRNLDGDFDEDGEAYDYVLHLTDSSVRNIILVPGAPPRLYYTSTALEQILSAWDNNADGLIDITTEQTIALDFPSHFGAATQEVNGIAYDGTAFYVTNDAGAQEGIWRCQDLNADGDFADNVGGIDETTPAVVEPTQVTINNAPNSGNPLLSVTALDSIVHDPTWGTNGRYLVEDENYDQTLAFEDMTGDGDFDDAGEVYLFVALWNGGTLVGDLNPDVAMGVLPASNELRDHVVDTSSGSTVYWFLSNDTTGNNNTAHGDDQALVFRATDNNNDGDINDAGEVTVYWDGSTNSTGATNVYNFCTGLDVVSGVPYVGVEWDDTPGSPDDTERLVRLDDNNPQDGDANDPGETVVLWDLGVDRTHYNPLVLQIGTLPSPPPGLPGTYRYFGDAICPSSLPGFHNVQIGTDNFNDKPTVGNANHHIRTWGANPSSPGAVAVGVSRLNPPFPIDPPTNRCNIYIFPLLDAPFTTDTVGEFDMPMPIPADPTLAGTILYWQSAVMDPGIAAGFTLSDAAFWRLGAFNYSYSVH